MLSYPTIKKDIVKLPIYAFDKIDGSNMRVEWNRKQAKNGQNGFSKYGSRRRLISSDEEPLGETVEIFEKDFAEQLEPVLRKLQVERATLFLEFYGDSSFAGYHENEQHYLSLFDVSLFKKGFMLPKDFIKNFENVVPTAPLLYHGNPNEDFVNQVKNGELDGMTFEGVVCKSQQLVRNEQVKFKVKNDAWLKRLKNKCGDDEKLFEKLA